MMVNTDKACDRCGLVVDRTELLDLDTGSCCHPEPIQCIRALRAKVRKLEEMLASKERIIKELKQLLSEAKDN